MLSLKSVGARQVLSKAQRLPARASKGQQQPRHAAAAVSAAVVVTELTTLAFHVSDAPTVPGQFLKVVGSPQELGAWNVAAAPVMEWQEGNIWALNLSPAPPTPFEFKLVIASADSADGALWEGGPNRTMMASPKHGARLVCTYSNPDAMVIDEFTPEDVEPTNNIVPAPRREPEPRNTTTALGGAGAAISAPTSAHRVVEHVQAPAPASPAPAARVQPRRGLPQEPTVFQTAHGTLTIMTYAD